MEKGFELIFRTAERNQQLAWDMREEAKALAFKLLVLADEMDPSKRDAIKERGGTATAKCC